MTILRCLLWVEPFWIVVWGFPLILPGRLLPVSMQPYIVGALFLFWPLRLLSRNQFTADQALVANPKAKFGSYTPLTILVFSLFSWLPINIWLSADRGISWVAAGPLFWGIALYVACTWGPIRYRSSLTLIFFLLIGSGLAVTSPLTVIWKPEFRLFYLPLYTYLQSVPIHLGERIHANILAGVLVIVLPLLLVLTLQRNWTTRRWLRSLCDVMTLLVLVVLILTQSRGGYLAIAIASLLMCYLCLPRFKYIIPLLIVAGILTVRYTALSMLLKQLSADGSLGGWDVRLDIWINSLQALSDFVYTGIGIGTFTVVMPLLYPLRYPIEGYPHAHNLFLQIGVDLGLPGLIAYLAILINLFVMLISMLRNPHTLPLHRTLAIGATGSLVGMLVHGLFDAVAWSTKLVFVHWILFALITQLFLYKQATASTPEQTSRS